MCETKPTKMQIKPWSPIERSRMVITILTTKLSNDKTTTQDH